MLSLHVSSLPVIAEITTLTAVRAYSRMSVNIPRTEVLCQCSSDPPTELPNFYISDSPLALVPHFKYLGSILSCDCNIDQDTQNRIQQVLYSSRIGPSPTTTCTLIQRLQFIRHCAYPHFCMDVRHGCFTAAT